MTVSGRIISVVMGKKNRKGKKRNMSRSERGREVRRQADSISKGFLMRSASVSSKGYSLIRNQGSIEHSHQKLDLGLKRVDERFVAGPENAL